jgi:Mor family transcriptional regulator
MLVISDRVVAMLPDSLKELAEVIGVDACLVLVEMFGGSRLYVPKSVGEEHRLWCLGNEVLKNLIAIFGGNFLQIPRAARLKKWERNQKIAEAHQNRSIAKIAKEFDLTERQVWAILRKMRNDAAEVYCEFAT